MKNNFQLHAHILKPVGESFQDYSSIQDFEIESQPQNAELGRL